MVRLPGAILETATVRIAVTAGTTAMDGCSDIATRLAWINAAFHLIRIECGPTRNAA
jgi:hypothetical protein